MISVPHDLNCCLRLLALLFLWSGALNGLPSATIRPNTGHRPPGGQLALQEWACFAALAAEKTFWAGCRMEDGARSTRTRPSCQ